MIRFVSLPSYLFVPLVCLTMIAPQARAVLVTSGAATLFHDGFENSTVGVTPGVNDPLIGTWNSSGTGPLSLNDTRTGATAGGPSAAYSGNNYLEFGRANGDQPWLGAVFANSATLATDSVSVEFQMFFKSQAQNFVYTLLQKSSLNAAISPRSNLMVPIGFGDNTGSGGLQLNMWYWNGGSDWVDTGLDLIDDAWNKVNLDWNHTTGKFTVSLNGGTPWEAPSIWGTADSLGALEFGTGWNTGKLYLDSTVVPEPSISALLYTGLLGLLFKVRPRRN
ncbi:MAG: hypothetical protein IT427_12810 [Pirellulales bacterium]|nr:hypothetical protein [Pirellulales bacterium]